MTFSFYHKVVAQFSIVISKKYFWWLSLGVLLLPFILLIFFNHPSADDYCYAVASMKQGFFESQINTYVNWSGRYVSSCLLGGGPLLFYSFVGYKIMNFLLLLFTVFTCLYFVKTLLNKNSLDLSVLVISVSVLFLYLSGMPNLTEGFYWMSGALTYQLPNIATLTVVAILLRMKKKYSIAKLISAMVLCVFICGGNETSMLEFLYILVAMMTFEYATTREIPKYYYWLFLVSLAATSITLLAPGNTVRGAFFHGEKNIFKAFLLAAGSGLSKLQEWLHDVLILLILCIPFFKQLDMSNADQRKITPVILVLYPLFIFGILIVGFLPAYWSVGSEPPTRTINVLYWLFVFSCLHYTTLWIGYIKQKNEFIVAVPTYVQWVLFFLLFRHWVPQNNYRTASMDIISGRAITYHRQMEERYVEMVNNKGREVVFKPLTAKPKSIFFVDIESGHPEDWKNVCTADYFYLKSLDLSKPVE